MNRKTYFQEQQILRLLSDCHNKDINKIKINVGATKSHEMKKCSVAYDLMKEGHRIVTEAIFKDGKGRCDILDITLGEAVEILQTEKEESIGLKNLKYPIPIRVVKVE